MNRDSFASIKIRAIRLYRILVERVLTRKTFVNLAMVTAIVLVGFGAGYYSLGAGLIAAGIFLSVFAFLLGLE